jgi:hypothetical protein
MPAELGEIRPILAWNRLLNPLQYSQTTSNQPISSKSLRTLEIPMRFVVLLFGTPGFFLIALTGVCMIFFNDAVGGMQEYTKAWFDFEFPAWIYDSFTGPPHANAGILLLLAAAYGFLGVIVSGMMRCGWQGALLMLFPLIFTAVMNPIVIPLTGLQAFAGLNSFLVFPLPINAPKEASDRDENEDNDD